MEKVKVKMNILLFSSNYKHLPIVGFSWLIFWKKRFFNGNFIHLKF